MAGEAAPPGSHQGTSSPRTPGLSVFKSLSSPGSPGLGGVVGGVEKDTDELFCSHTVQEIKQIEQQTRLDIDRRKEDLRQMVGSVSNACTVLVFIWCKES